MLRGSGCSGSRSDPFSLVLAKRVGRRSVVTEPGAVDRSPSRRGEREREVVGTERKSKGETGRGETSPLGTQP